MEQETKQQSASQDETRRDAVVTPAQGDVVGAPPTSEATCPTCAGTIASKPPPVYAVGRIEARFPRLSVEKEFAQAAGRAETEKQTDQQMFYNVLLKPESLYLARELCWVLTIQGLETYIVHPRDRSDFGLLVKAIKPEPSPMDIDVVVGMRGPIAPPELCNGLMVPIVIFDQVYSFKRDELIKAIPRPEGMQEAQEAQFDAAAGEVLDRILQMTDNLGATDDHRALNYLAMRYPGIYTKTAEEFARDFSLTGVEVRPSPLRSTRNIVDVIFSYTNRNAGDLRDHDRCAQAQRCVDRGRGAAIVPQRRAKDSRRDLILHQPPDGRGREVLRPRPCDEEFLFLVTNISPYYDR